VITTRARLPKENGECSSPAVIEIAASRRERVISLHISRRRLRTPRVCETNQLDRKTFGHRRAGSVCTYSLSVKNVTSQLERSPLSNSLAIAQGRSSNLFSHISPEK
jgi:hypothetical protein